MLQYIINFKIHIQTSLESYEEFVAAEVEREWEEQEAVNANADADLGAEDDGDPMEE